MIASPHPSVQTDTHTGTVAGDLPVRLVARHTSDALLTSSRRWQDALGIDRVDTLIVQAILSGNLAHLPSRNAPAGLAAPDACRRPVSLLAIAQSMRLPYETVRRRATVLRRQGLLVAADGGHIVPAALVDEPTARGAPATAHDAAAFRALVDAVRADGVDLPPLPSPPPSDALLARSMLDLAVRCLADFTALHGGVVQGTVRTTIIAINVRALIDDADRSRLYASEDAVPPDALRRPATTRALANELGMPAITVRRHVAALVGGGDAERVGNGVIIPARSLMSEPLCRYYHLILANLRRALLDLTPR